MTLEEENTSGTSDAASDEGTLEPIRCYQCGEPIEHITRTKNGRFRHCKILKSAWVRENVPDSMIIDESEEKTTEPDKTVKSMPVEEVPAPEIIAPGYEMVSTPEPIAAATPEVIKAVPEPLIERDTIPRFSENRAQPVIDIETVPTSSTPIPTYDPALLNTATEIAGRYRGMLMRFPRVTEVDTIVQEGSNMPTIRVLASARCPAHADIPPIIEGVPVILVLGGTEKPKTIVDKFVGLKKWGLFFEGPARRSLKTWLKTRQTQRKGLLQKRLAGTRQQQPQTLAEKPETPPSQPPVPPAPVIEAITRE